MNVVDTEAKIAELIEEAKLEAIIQYTGEQNRDGWKCDGWHITFKHLDRSNKAEMDSVYYTGIGHRKDGKPKRPGLAGILSSLLSDGQVASETFEDFCADLGYSTDSRKALDTYLACQDSGRKLRFFGYTLKTTLAKLLEDY